MSCLVVSCASILNEEWTPVSVYTEQPAKAIVRGDTLRTKPRSNANVLSFSVPRSSEPLQFVLQSDSLRKTISIPSKNSQNYYLNALYFWPGFFVDKSNPKRYTYNSRLTFDKNLDLYDDRFITRKGDLNFYFSLPFIYLSLNTINPEDRSRITRGSVLGLSAGFDYYYKKDRFINLTGSMSFSNLSGCGGYYVPDEWLDEPYVDDGFHMWNLNVSHNHRLKRFSFGYGLSYNYTFYRKDTYSMPPNYVKPEDDFYDYHTYPHIYNHQRSEYTTLGFVFNGYCYTSRNFSVGIIYKPNILRLKSQSGNPFCYEHQITLDFAFRFNLLRRK
ncbi:hypothetical protein FACS1894169_05580 [Bacteroidia bacterium]|nr:hypothetical protein FACS1894169_05580 [Bacteroidia bacterium]